MSLASPVILSVGDLVYHPITGHVGFITGQDAVGMWMVDWFASREGTLLAQSVYTVEYDAVLRLQAKAVGV